MKKRKKKKPNTESVFSSFVEISIDPALINGFSTEHSLNNFLSNLSSSSDFQKLKNELIKEVMNIINSCLTKRQKEIVKMTFIDGKTQNEISSKIGRHQTAVHKVLQGNIDYANRRKRYGGAIKKIRKMCSRNKKIQEILDKIKEKNEEFCLAEKLF